MISLRYHIVSVAAVFLALAVGVVLGSTALNGSLLSGLASEKSDLATQVSTLESERNALDARLRDADAFAGVVGPKVVAGQLDQRTVVLVTTPDADPAHRDALRRLVEQSGAAVTGEVQLTEAFTDPDRAGQLREVVTRLQPAGAQFPTAGDPGTLAGALLGSVLLVDKESARPQSSPEELAAALGGLTDGGFVKPAENVKPAQLAVVLTGGKATGDGAGDRAAILARFATQLDRSGAGTVLTGNPAAAEGTGAIGVARADTATTSILSTVDNVDSAAGRVVTVLALREQLEGGSGRYGVAGNAQGPAPGATTDGS
ncbi:Copper transport outer membrane protein, MctB [Amycolatopsis arida]|uniref:Copper transport outer membrane protein, MctB n=1 Tax=Amycolatopsis arida TaxID=587909 RepID=A0A1I6AXF3_9PSEU|nr:copper transporter [Amycolatopsis arida]TDX85350.1 copper transport outer membrane protein MctB [Amycolatopsis arida]SFQ73380.1 Copper transport outer membrane protein, MctB [Amycolatopsis arida]